MGKTPPAGAALAEDRSGVRGLSLWICWPKKASGLAPDLNEDIGRNRGLAVGLGDY